MNKFLEQVLESARKQEQVTIEASLSQMTVRRPENGYQPVVDGTLELIMQPLGVLYTTPLLSESSEGCREEFEAHMVQFKEKLRANGFDLLGRRVVPYTHEAKKDIKL